MMKVTLENVERFSLDYWLMRVVFSIYTGWVTAATILNVSFVFKISFGLDTDDD